MDQQKIGAFLKELRKDKAITQEQFAEILNVSNRSVSRWETGRNMPDLDILIQVADYYEVELGEILDGKRKGEQMDRKMEETVMKVADYSNDDKMKLTKRMHYLFITGTAALIVCIVLEEIGLTEKSLYENIASFALGFSLAILGIGVLFTSRSMGRIRAFKMRLLKYKKQ